MKTHCTRKKLGRVARYLFFSVLKFLFWNTHELTVFILEY